MSSIYNDGSYLARNPTWHEEDSSWKAAQILRILKDNNIAPATICEIGCGAGEILKCLEGAFGDRVALSGYEISEQAFAICSRKETRSLHFFLTDGLDDARHEFDVAMALDVFEHVEDYFDFLRRFRNMATYKIFHIPLDLSVLTVLIRSHIATVRRSFGHIHYFTKDTALASLKDTGYEVIDCFYTMHSLELPGRGWKANLLRLPRILLFALNQDLAARILGGVSLMVLAK